MLSVSNLSFQRDQITTLQPVEFTLSSGELMVVRGENGSGKTTLLRLLAGLLPKPENAQISLYGNALRPGSAEAGAAVQYLGHQLGLKDELSCLENTEFWAGFTGTRKGQSPRSVLDSVRLGPYRYTEARQLSAGQRKRLALARLLLNPGEIWLLDEPYSNLDAEGIRLVDRLLSTHLVEGGMAITTSHGTFVPELQNVRELKLAVGQ